MNCECASIALELNWESRVQPGFVLDDNLIQSYTTLMMRYTTYRVHVAGIPKVAVGVLHGLIAYTEHTTRIAFNRMSLEKFRALVNLSPETALKDIMRIMSQCAKAVASIKQYEQVGTRRTVLLTGSWPVFRYISITASEVVFEICPLMWEDRDERFPS